MMNVNTSVHKDMRVMRISSNYVIANMTDIDLSVATLAVPNSLTNLQMPNDLTSQSIKISPSTDQRLLKVSSILYLQ